VRALTTAAVDPATLRRLRSALRGTVLTPEDAGYDAARRVWNARRDRRPALIARCRGAADVVECVRLAREAGLLLSVRGSGHHAAGDAVCEGGLVIDLSEMSSVRVDAAAATVRVEPGATWRHVDRETQLHGLATTGAMVSTVGVAGVTLGGGLGWLMRRFGLALDNLRSADVVTAGGHPLTASAGEHPDLFWALRGGGGNFGVVTSLELALHPVGPTVTGGLLLHPMARAAELLRFVRDFVAGAPDELGCVATLWTAPPAPFVPPDLRGAPAAAILVCHSGPAEEAERCLAPLRAFGPPAVDRIARVPYTVVQRMLDPAGVHGRLVEVAADHLAGLPDAAIDVLVERAGRLTSPLSVVNVVAMGGVVARTAPSATAYSHRAAPFHYAAYAMWEDPAETDRHVAWAGSVRRALAPYAAGAYVNELGDEGDERTRAAYTPETLARLTELKRRHDPDNLFRHNRNVAP
jgi:FAD/FMN-containing dehydrogenase